MLVFDSLRPEKVGPPLHLHTDCDEWFFVREGTFTFQAGNDSLRLSPGDSLLVPPATAHAARLREDQRRLASLATNCRTRRALTSTRNDALRHNRGR